MNVNGVRPDGTKMIGFLEGIQASLDLCTSTVIGPATVEETITSSHTTFVRTTKVLSTSTVTGLKSGLSTVTGSSTT